jgi:hypothetical protein
LVETVTFDTPCPRQAAIALATCKKSPSYYDASQAVLSTFDLDEVLQRILVIARDYFRRKTLALSV